MGGKKKRKHQKCVSAQQYQRLEQQYQRLDKLYQRLDKLCRKMIDSQGFGHAEYWRDEYREFTGKDWRP
jgi:hypothetical protein